MAQASGGRLRRWWDMAGSSLLVIGLWVHDGGELAVGREDEQVVVAVGVDVGGGPARLVGQYGLARGVDEGLADLGVDEEGAEAAVDQEHWAGRGVNQEV